MPYTKQTWENGSAGGTPVSAARLRHIEDGISDAATGADSALDGLAAHIADPGAHGGGGGGGGGIATVTAADSTVVVNTTGSDVTVRVATGVANAATGAAQKSSNLSDLTDASAARTSLGLGNSATRAVGTTTGTVAAGDDTRITGAAQKSANLSDLANAATARTNLGLGGAAVLSVGTTAGTVAAGNDSRLTRYFEPGVYLTEDRYPGCTSDDFTIASAARDLAIQDCFKDPTGAITTRPRPLILPPCPRNTAVATGSKAGYYSWNTLDFDWVTKTAMGVASPSGSVKLGWSVQGAHGRDMYGSTGIKSPSNANAFAFGSGYNHMDFMLKGLTFVGRENIATTNDWFRVPGGQAFYDLVLDSIGVQWYRYQLRGAFGRLTIQGTNNFNNAAGQPIQIGGSDGGIFGVLYLDSRALTAGTYLLEMASLTSFKALADIYITPNSAGGLKATGRCEGLVISGLEVNGLGVQAPETCSDATAHIGSGLLTGSPSVDPTTAPGLIYFDTTSKKWVKSDGDAQNTGTGAGWSLYYDGTAAIGFNGMANRPAIGSATAGKVYQNTGAEPNGSAGTDPTISYWIPWKGMWHGPSYWNKASVPSLASGASPAHVMTPVYVGCDAPGLYLNGVKGSVHVEGSVKMVNELPDIIVNSDGAIQVVDAYDPPVLNVEVSQLGSGRRAIAVANSGAVDSVDVHAKIVTSKIPVGDTPLGTKRTGNCRVIRDGVWTATKSSSETRTNTATPTDITGLDVIVGAGESVTIEGELYVASSGSPIGNAKFQWSTGGTDLTGKVTFDGLTTGATNGAYSRNSGVCTTNAGGAVGIGVPNGNAQVVKVTGRLIGGTTVSTWRIQAAQNTAVATDVLTILGDSWITAKRTEV